MVEEIDPVEAGNAALAYYRPASLEGGRPGAHCVLTADPGSRFRYEYEALAFHESVPGHHLQISSALLLPDLPRYRKHLDAQLCAYIEGWGLYSEPARRRDGPVHRRSRPAGNALVRLVAGLPTGG